MSNKAWYQRYKRKSGIRRQKEQILIVCQGEKTEPNYFKSFRLVTADIEIDYKNREPKKLIERAIKLCKNAKKLNNKNYDQVWVVFDKDDTPINNFDNAISYAKSLDVKVAYSNQAFELWYLLHFNFYNSPISRKEYGSKLEKLLKAKYKKNSTEMYQTLLSKQNKAIKNAGKLLRKYKSNSPGKANPSTTVHLLVMELNKFKQ